MIRSIPAVVQRSVSTGGLSLLLSRPKNSNTMDTANSRTLLSSGMVEGLALFFLVQTGRGRSVAGRRNGDASPQEQEAASSSTMTHSFPATWDAPTSGGGGRHACRRIVGEPWPAGHTCSCSWPGLCSEVTYSTTATATATATTLRLHYNHNCQALPPSRSDMATGYAGTPTAI
jgi:hypothetical protein